MPYGNINVDTVTTSTSGGILGAGNASIMKNRIINGAMVIDQRNAGASVTATSDNQYSVDRWAGWGQGGTGGGSKYTMQQNAGSVTAPVGFYNYLGVTSLSAYSVQAGDYYSVAQAIEGLNTLDLGWGTSDAKTVTLSFWVRSSLTGTFGGALQNSARNRCYPFTYTISSANTWTQVSVNVTGETSGTWVKTNGVGILLVFGLGVGSTYSGTAGSWSTSNLWSATGATSVVGTNGATFYITGVQLEVGSSATGFEYRLYNQELSACQRYYFRLTNDSGGTITLANLQAYSAGAAFGKILDLPVQMRSTPTGTLSAIGSFNPSNTAGAGLGAFSSGSIDSVTKNILGTGGFGGSSGLTGGNCTGILMVNNAWLAVSAEL